jgi:hypothetical protein
MRSFKHRFAFAASVFVLATVLACPVVLAAAGKVLLVTGTAKVNRGSERELKSGDAIEVGDVISAGIDSHAQLLMADGARIALQPGSTIRIDEFSLPSSVLQPELPGSAATPGKSVATLLTGRISASPGAIGAITFNARGRVVSLTGRRADFVSIDAADLPMQPTALPDVAERPELAMSARSRLGLSVDLIQAHLPLPPQVSTAIAVPASGAAPFATSSTEKSNTFAFNGGGSILQFNAPSHAGGVAADATFLSGTAALVDFGGSGSSGIRWGRWSTGSASITTINGGETVSLQNASLHWIAGPTFEAPPVLPTSGSVLFTLAGGTSPTDTSGHAGLLSAGVLTADFTAQQVSAALSLDVNGYNWFASGSGPLTANTARFGGTFNKVLVDGRVPGNGAFSGFLSAGALTPDQLNGAGLSYWLVAGSLGTVSGVAAFVPGATQPLSPPVVHRDVAYAGGGLAGATQSLGAASNSRAQLASDIGGNLLRFDAPLPTASSGTLAIGVSHVTDAGFDALTGIRWGRWEGGAIDVTAPPSPAQSHDLTGRSLPWIEGNEFGAAPILPQTGTATYTLIGNTNPTDTLANTGTLGVASFNADFSNRSITSALTLNVAGREWYASGRATFSTGSNRFAGTYDDVRIDNLVSGQGALSGFFTQPRISSGSAAGAGVAFNLADDASQLGVISGVLAFVNDGPGAVVTPPPTASRDIAMVSPDFASAGNSVQRALPADYALDTSFNLVSMPGVTNTTPVEAARYSLGTSATSESDVSSLVMLRWGRWSGGSATVTNIATSASYAVDLTQRSLHWIEGADSSAPPVMPQFGTANYALIGATSPTDRAGNVGMLNNAALSADFTHQSVSASFDVTVNHVNIIATGDGSIGQAGLAAHQFAGSITGGVISTTQTAPQGSFSGFFSAPGGTVPGTPGGAGLTYTLTDGQGGLAVDGAAAFRGP